jgi:hypothetical protein
MRAEYSSVTRAERTPGTLLAAMSTPIVDADAGATDQHAHALAAGDPLADRDGVIGVIDRFVARGAEVRDLHAPAFERRLEVRPQLDARVVAAQEDPTFLHLPIP